MDKPSHEARADYAQTKQKHEYRMTKARAKMARRMKKNTPKALPSPGSVLKFLLGK